MGISTYEVRLEKETALSLTQGRQVCYLRL